jgi:hypothetical protein
MTRRLTAQFPGAAFPSLGHEQPHDAGKTESDERPDRPSETEIVLYFAPKRPDGQPHRCDRNPGPPARSRRALIVDVLLPLQCALVMSVPTRQQPHAARVPWRARFHPVVRTSILPAVPGPFAEEEREEAPVHEGGRRAAPARCPARIALGRRSCPASPTARPRRSGTLW